MFKHTLFISTLALLVLACSQSNEKDKPTETQSNTVQTDHKKPPLACFDALYNYLKLLKITPSMTINTTDFENKAFVIPNNKNSDIVVSWKNQNDALIFNINDDVISTKNKQSLNVVWTEPNALAFTNAVRHIKYYQFEERLLINLYNDPCTGLGCGVSNTIIYDLAHKKASYFGHFSSGITDLYRINQNGQLIDAYLASTFSGRDETGIDSTTLVPYIADENGGFKRVDDSKGKPYFIKLNYKRDEPNRCISIDEKWFEAWH